MTAPVDLPAAIARLGKDARGAPVPFYIRWTPTGPDLHAVAPGAFAHCIRTRSCWACGGPLAKAQVGVFCVPAVGVVERLACDPPMHADCARWAASVYPGLACPSMRSREAGLPAGQLDHIEGLGIQQPGLCYLWATPGYRVVRRDGHAAIELGDPDVCQAWAAGRPATSGEIIVDMARGIARLRPAAAAEGPASMALLNSAANRALRVMGALRHMIEAASKGAIWQRHFEGKM